MTRPVITVDQPMRAFCQCCNAHVLTRTIHLGPNLSIRLCPLDRVALREALTRAAGDARDVLRADAAEAVA